MRKAVLQDGSETEMICRRIRGQLGKSFGHEGAPPSFLESVIPFEITKIRRFLVETHTLGIECFWSGSGRYL